MQDRILIMSHASDSDGALPVILTKLVYKEVDNIFLEVDETDDKILEYLNDEIYDFIYMVDLGISEETCNKIMHSKLKDKFKIFDHHISRKEIIKYPFVTLIETDELGIKQCGTTIYYKYLKSICDNGILEKQVTKDIIELVRQIDTWDWIKTNNIQAKRIEDLYNIVGRENFIKIITDKIIENDTFFFNDNEKYVLKLEQDKINRYILEKKENIIKAKIDGHKVGVVFAERYRSELGNVLANTYDGILEFIIVINLDKSISYRSVKDNDVSVFAKKYGGGGHKNASGSSINGKIKTKVIKLLFSEVEILDEN